MPELKKLTLVNVKGGAAVEAFDQLLPKILANLKDPATSPTKARQIALVISFVPVEDRHGQRNEARIGLSVKSTLAPPVFEADDMTSVVHMHQRGDEIRGYVQDVRQEGLEFPDDEAAVDKATGEILPIRKETSA